jgi:U4/U6 small nuclear ribonucleoprotein PRP31
MLGRIKTSATLGSLANTSRYKELMASVSAIHQRPSVSQARLPHQKRPRDDDDDEDADDNEDDDSYDRDDEDVVVEDMPDNEGSQEGEGDDQDETEAHNNQINQQLREDHYRLELSHDLNEETLLIKDLDNDKEYQLILRINDLLQEIDEELQATIKFSLEIYAHKFPELPTILTNQLELIRVIQRIGNEMDLTEIDLRDILTPQQIMIVSVSASTTQGKALSDSQLQDMQRGCSAILGYYEDKTFLLSFVSKHINRIAPNLSILIGSQLTAQLIGLVGGLVALAKIPACNIQVIGQQKSNNFGLSTLSTKQHEGIIGGCDLVVNAPPDLKKKVLKILAGKVALAARIDSYQVHFNNKEGLKLRQEIEGKVDKLQEPPKARTKKALPIPEEKKKSRRGGKRIRKMKERFMTTELQKQQNKIQFTLDGGEYGDSAMGNDNGSVFNSQNLLYGGSGTSIAGGKIRGAAQVKSQFLKKSNKAIKASSGQTNGMSSSLVFTPVQGLELVDPTAAQEKLKHINKKWFDAHSGFISALPKNR